MKFARIVLASAVLAASAAHADSIVFPMHIVYSSIRWAATYGNRIRVCPLPSTYAVCSAGAGWIDPDVASPVPGYKLRHVVRRGDGSVVLYFCPDPGKCEGDD